MTTSELNKVKNITFRVNPALNALVNVPMFEDKIAEANEILRTVGLPDPIIRLRKKRRNKKSKPNQQVLTLSNDEEKL